MCSKLFWRYFLKIDDQTKSCLSSLAFFTIWTKILLCHLQNHPITSRAICSEFMATIEYVDLFVSTFTFCLVSLHA